MANAMWTYEAAPDGAFVLRHEAGLLLKSAAPCIEQPDGVLQPDMDWRITFEGAPPTRVVHELPGVCRITLAFDQPDDAAWISVGTSVTNTGAEPLPIRNVVPLHCLQVESTTPLNRCYRHGSNMADYTTLHPFGASHESHSCAAFTDADGTTALALGFTPLDQAFCDIESVTEAPDVIRSLRAVYQREDIPLAPGQTLDAGRLLIGAGPSMSQLLTTYAGFVAKDMEPRLGPVETGWCSWYYYYGLETEQDIIANAEALGASSFKDHIHVIQIDDGWNRPARGADGGAPPRVWGDWDAAGDKFPHGMRYIADRIKEKGFIPGLWLAPFSVNTTSRLRQDHPAWLVQGDDGPAEYWGVNGLDLTHPEALAFLEETFTRVFDEWGFGYVKIDFLLHGAQRGRRYDPTVTTVQAFRQGLAVIRKVAKNRFILNCGSPLGPSIGFCDGMRVGYDVSSRWNVPMNPGSWPAGNCNIRAALIHSYWHQWMHGMWWRNDPDCLVVRDHGSSQEKVMFKDLMGGASAAESPYGLSMEEAGAWVRFVWMSGTMAIISENMNDLSQERLALLERAFPLNPRPAHWLDCRRPSSVFSTSATTRSRCVYPSRR